MLDLEMVRKVLEDFNENLEKNQELLTEALIFLVRLEKEDYSNKKEKKNFETDLRIIVEELEIGLDECII